MDKFSKTWISAVDGVVFHGDIIVPEQHTQTLLMIHGMSENRQRYDSSAAFFAQTGKVVCTFDLRGHGDSPVAGHYGHFAEKSGYLANIKDIAALVKELEETYGHPVILLGHSMGSLFARGVLANGGCTLQGVLLSGSPSRPAALPLARPLVNILAQFNAEKESALLDKLINGGFNRQVSHPKTAFDWLSYNEENVQAYIASERCGFRFTAQGYKDLIDLMCLVYDEKWSARQPDLPICFYSGKEDPCADFKHDGLAQSVVNLKRRGFKHVDIEIFEHSRHEILFDNDQAAVRTSMTAFMDHLN